MAKETWMWLAAGLGHGAVNTGELLAAFPDGAEAIHDALGSDALDDILTQKQAEKLADSRPSDFALTLARAEAMDVVALPFDDPDYPDILRSISTPPPILFVKGDLTLLNGQLSVGIVGARRPSAYGVEAVKAVGRGVALGGAIIVSGLAAGLDAEAHKAALAVNGPTIACIAFGHDSCYPAANRKLMEVIGKYGAVVSEYPVGTGPEKPFFLQRNRLIAGLSHALVVAEARKYSGTMSTVNFATDYGRDVFAVPGSIFSELSGGTNAMIREGAYVAASATDILSLYGIELPGEDPVAAASKQAAEGRPLPASATPAWREAPERSLNREDREEAPRRDLSEMTLGEALQSAAARGEDERVSSRQAIDAFRQLQREMPPADDAALDARNRALDEMVQAVSDTVEISNAGNAGSADNVGVRKAPQAPPPKPSEPEDRVKPFDWSNVEKLTKGKDSGKPVARRTPPAPPIDIRGMEPISAIEPISPVMPVGAVQAVEPANRVSRPGAQPKRPERGPSEPKPSKAAPSQPAQTAAPRPAVQKSGSLTDKLRTLHHDEPHAAGDLTAGLAFAPTETVEDGRLAALTEDARKAYGQLGAQPTPLAKIVEGSGLSSGQAMAALTELELAGLSRQLAGRQFVIVQ